MTDYRLAIGDSLGCFKKQKCLYHENTPLRNDLMLCISVKSILPKAIKIYNGILTKIQRKQDWVAFMSQPC